MKKLGIIILLALLICLIAFLIKPSPKKDYVELGPDWAQSYVRQYKAGEFDHYTYTEVLVKDEKAAIAIALPIWNIIYGKDKIQKEAPYFAYLIDDYWVVTGSLPKGSLGGTAKAIIERKTGKVVHVIHWK
jgi:hypothetical protein